MHLADAKSQYESSVEKKKTKKFLDNYVHGFHRKFPPANETNRILEAKVSIHCINLFNISCYLHVIAFHPYSEYVLIPVSYRGSKSGSITILVSAREIEQ